MRRHERRSSTGAALLSGASETVGRKRRPSTGGRALDTPVPVEEYAEGESFHDDRDVHEDEHDREGRAERAEREERDDEREREGGREFKQVYLKGLFS